MGTKENPGQFDCHDKAEANEPLFTLLARDEDAPELVEDWCRKKLAKLLASDLGRPILHKEVAKIAEALACANAMREWRTVSRQGDANWSGLPLQPPPLEHGTLADCASRFTNDLTGFPKEPTIPPPNDRGVDWRGTGGSRDPLFTPRCKPFPKGV